MADKFDRFNDHARHVLALAQEEAHRFNHNYIGTEHFLLGLVREGDGVAARVLSNMGVQLPKVRSAVEFIIGRGDRAPRGDLGLTPRAKKVIELAVDEARRLNHDYIGTEHLLLGLVREGEGIAAGVLDSLGVSLEKARVETLKAIGAIDQSPFPAEIAQPQSAAPRGPMAGVTEEARAVLDRAREESRQRRDGRVGTEHLLLAMIQEQGIAWLVLTNLGTDLKSARQGLGFILGPEGKGDAGETGLTSRARSVIDLADDEARQLRHRHLNSGHLLLGILREGSGVTSGMLVGLGLGIDATRAEMKRLLG